MSKKRKLSIQTSSESIVELIPQQSFVEVAPLVDHINRYLAPYVKYTFDEFSAKYPDKINKLIAYANLSDEALIGYVKTLIVPEIIIKETEED